MSSSGMGVQCYASCPPSTVCIQPPSFVLNIPGPELYCPDQPLKIEQNNPCAGMGGGRALGGSGGAAESFISLDAGNNSGEEAGDNLGSEDSMELFLRRPWGRPGWGRPGWGRPGWGRPGWGGYPGWGRPGWGRPGWGRPGWGRPGWGRPGWNRPGGRWGINTELDYEDTNN